MEIVKPFQSHFYQLYWQPLLTFPFFLNLPFLVSILPVLDRGATETQGYSPGANKNVCLPNVNDPQGLPFG